MDRREFIGGLAGLSGTGGLGCRPRPREPAPSRLRVGITPRITHASLYLAEELGLVAQAGLQLEIAHFSDVTQMIPLLAGGKLDVVFGQPTPAFINAVGKGARMRLVAGRDIASPSCGAVGVLYGNRKVFPEGLKDLQRLRGKRVAISGPTSFSSFCLDALLASAGMSSRELRLASLRPAEAAAALVGGKLDAMVSSTFDKDLESLSPQIVRGIGLAQVLPNHQYSFVVFGPTLLDGDPERGVAFLATYLRGAEEFLKGKTPRYLAELARAGGMDPDLASRACRDYFTRDGSIDQASVRRYIDWAASKGYSAPGVEVSQLIDTRFVERARRRMQGLEASLNR